jgi:hypothetical protein
MRITLKEFMNLEKPIQSKANLQIALVGEKQPIDFLTRYFLFSVETFLNEKC